MKSPENVKKKKARGEPGFSRRGFMQGVGLGTGALGGGLLTEPAAAQTASVAGPGAVDVALKINGKTQKISVEPRVTLLDALRDYLDMTGAKRACDRGTCGTCTVIMDGKAVYACSVLAIDAQGCEIETIEGLVTGASAHPIIAAFVDNDAQQCGYCTPGFVMASKAFLDRNLDPTYEHLREGLGGNLCRCGTYVGIRQAVLDAAEQLKQLQRG